MSIRTRRGDPASRRRATVFDVSGTTPPEWRSYQELTEELMRRLGATDGITTLRLEREVPVSGRANDNCIDVLWEVEGVSGERVRLLFECRSYKRRINQQALHSWRSIVDDVSERGVETIGVMVTTTGYQSGAQRVADTYGIVILELRAPTARDLANRWRSARIELVCRMPQVTDLTVSATEQLGPDASVNGALGEFVLDFEDGTSELLMDHLLRGELASIEEPPTAAEPAARQFAMSTSGNFAQPPQLEPVGVSSVGVTLVGVPASTDLSIDARAASFFLASHGETSPGRVYLQLDDIQGERNPGRLYGVYLNLPDGADPSTAEAHHAASLSFFAMERSCRGCTGT
jgi:restriction endonuclease